MQMHFKTEKYIRLQRYYICNPPIIFMKYFYESVTDQRILDWNNTFLYIHFSIKMLIVYMCIESILDLYNYNNV